MSLLSLSRPVALVNARVVAEQRHCGSLRFDTRIRGLDEPPRRGDEVLDLQGAFVLPGLVNAHDHLELNHYGALKMRSRYENASAWIEDLRSPVTGDPVIRERRAYPLAARLFIGGLKNLLAGVTTVAHHNPLYREIGRAVPIRVVSEFGWAHSFELEARPVGAHGEPGGRVHERCAATPAHAPFIVHLGEGTDAAAAAEFPRLDRLGCVRRNTVVVHGVALAPPHWRRMMSCGASLVWCPSSNRFLFGRTAPIREFLDAAADAWQHVALGSDSRITGSADLLEELKVAAGSALVTGAELLRMVTISAARALKLPDAGKIAVGAPADLLVVPASAAEPGDALLASRRRDVSLVAVGGRPLVSDPSLGRVFDARRTTARPIVVDGAVRLADCRLARQIERCPIQESGVGWRA
jgi:cytosine/adenosine deaminase-related metal-dependent hydrolase